MYESYSIRRTEKQTKIEKATLAVCPYNIAFAFQEEKKMKKEFVILEGNIKNQAKPRPFTCVCSCYRAYGCFVCVAFISGAHFKLCARVHTQTHIVWMRAAFFSVRSVSLQFQSFRKYPLNVQTRHLFCSAAYYMCASVWMENAEAVVHTLIYVFALQNKRIKWVRMHHITAKIQEKSWFSFLFIKYDCLYFISS